MTDQIPAGPARKRTTAAKTRAAANATAPKAAVAKAPAAKPAAAKVPVAKPAASAAKAPVVKAPVTKAPTVKAPAAKAPAAKLPAAKALPTAKAPAARKVAAETAPATTLPPVEPTPATTAAPAAAIAPAGWYPVAAGSAQQRWWDGARWTEHVYGPTTPAAAPPATVAQPVAGRSDSPALAAPAGTKPGTVWFWLIAIGVPVLTLLDLIPTSIYLSQVIGGDNTDPATFAASTFSPAYLLVALSGWFIYAVCIVFALLDWRELKAHGVQKPFHWAWSFFVVVVGWPAVYVIGRSVVVKRRTGGGLAPLWVFIGLEVVVFVATLIVVVTAIVQLINDFGNLLSTAGNVL